MVWTYRDAGPWGAGVGRPLVTAEGDGNTYETQQRILALEAQIPVPKGVADVTVSGTQWTMTLQDGTVLGPFTMPVPHFKARAPWTPLTTYAVLDIVPVPGVGLFLVNQNHTSDATFDPNKQLNGENVYRQLIATSVLSAVTTISLGTHTPAVAEAGSHFRCTAASGTVVTLPSEATAPVPIRTVYQYEQVSDGQVQFIAENVDVTVNKPPTRDTRTAEKFATVAAIKVGTNEWTLGGYLAALEEEI